tara:strand:+ start:2217 stop:2456 length:240 start_codon:yes stop_codon:yes gene_type:complete
MKVSKKQLRRIIKESVLEEFWGKKPAAQPSQSNSDPFQVASDAMSDVVAALWGEWDNPPDPELLKKAQDLHAEIKGAIK